MPAPPTLAIIIPTWREAERLPALAAHLAQVAPDAQVVVVDGESDDGTAECARSLGLAVVSGRKGRAAQMNLGAAQTDAAHLLFLHADTALPAGVAGLVAETLRDKRVALGGFGFRFDARGWRIGFVEMGARFRNWVRPWPYGDQAIFLRRDTFEALGGFAPLALMEDMELVKRARARGRIVVRPEPAVTSARRYLERGPLRLMVRHWWLSVRFFAGWRPGPGEEIPL